MPIDEQLREQFEVFLATWFDEYDRALLTPKRLSRRKAAFEAGYAARDAEVQALRELVSRAKRIFQYAEVSSGYCVCGETLARHSHLADCSYTDRGQWESELWLKRAAALRGEEGINDE